MHFNNLTTTYRLVSGAQYLSRGLCLSGGKLCKATNVWLNMTQENVLRSLFRSYYLSFADKLTIMCIHFLIQIDEHIVLRLGYMYNAFTALTFFEGKQYTQSKLLSRQNQFKNMSVFISFKLHSLA